ncbi:hypothetical protein [Nannocystis pusilla]|uniref:Tryptophan synthase alpha chain n=1 Tax=Nannocystis pusilla TaxID=889268 RepID=A0ABS7TZT9_9BACT|nr:hypothetical protein [Nannocystis pusilla]MBZ5713733.1 hypothetical protein [Nannocystis pusilla]
MLSIKRAASCITLFLAASCGDGEDPLATVSAGMGPAGGPGGGPSGDPSGDPTDGGNTSAGTDTAGVDRGICDTYLACVAAATPDALPAAEMSYGPDSPCWQGSSGAAELCLMACEQNLATLGSVYPDVPACGGSSATTSGGPDITTSGPWQTTGDDPSDPSDPSASAGSLSEATTVAPPCDDPQPNGAPCFNEGCACLSGKCYQPIDAPSVCGECIDDDDCPGGGCSAPVDGQGSFCNTGGLGQGCETDQACGPAAPLCLDVYEDNPIPGLPKTCSECATDADCPAQTPYCAPSFGSRLFAGHRACVAPGSLPNDAGCSLAPGGGAACSSGICSEVSLMGVFPLGLCGECTSDADCDPGASCTGGVATPGAMKGTTCQ